MKIKIKDNYNFDFLKRFPKLTLEKLLKVFNLIEAQIPLAIDNPEIIEIEAEKYLNENLTDKDVLDILYAMKEDIDLGFITGWECTSRVKDSKRNIKIYIPFNQLARFLKFGKTLKKALIENKTLKSNEEIRRKKRERTENTIALYPDGNLCKKSKCYLISQKSKRYKIVRFLVSNRNYQMTELIASDLSISEDTIRREKPKINNNAEKFLQIKKLIEGKKGSGYRINPKYDIVLKN